MSLPVIPQDKANHIVYGSVIFAVAYALAAFQRLPALEIAAAATLLLAIGKEVYDRANRATHTPDPLDALATIAGGALCAIPVLLGG